MGSTYEVYYDGSIIELPSRVIASAIRSRSAADGGEDPDITTKDWERIEEEFGASPEAVKLRTDAAMADLRAENHALRTAVLAWWNDHCYDTIPDGDGDEYNMFDEPPAFVQIALGGKGAGE